MFGMIFDSIMEQRTDYRIDIKFKLTCDERGFDEVIKIRLTRCTDLPAVMLCSKIVCLP